MSKVSIIVVNWNGENLLEDCLVALFHQTYEDHEIIVVDNGSTDLSVQFVEKNFRHVRIIKLPENKGFTGGNLEGLKLADGEFIALVNNDARVEQQWLENLAQPMLDDARIGICASKLLLDTTGQINSAGICLTTSGVGFDRGYGEDASVYGSPERVFGACGAAVLYRRAMLEEIGFLDEDFFLYGEDADL